MSDLLNAEYGIRQLHARYIDALWRKDAAALAKCYDEEGEWNIAGLHMRGRDEIAAAFEKLIAPQHRVLMRIGVPLLDIGVGVATGRLYATEDVKRNDGTAARNIGIYEDRYAGEGPLWRFLSRSWTLVYKGAPDLSDPFLV